jgi:hypothetical protein
MGRATEAWRKVQPSVTLHMCAVRPQDNRHRSHNGHKISPHEKDLHIARNTRVVDGGMHSVVPKQFMSILQSHNPINVQPAHQLLQHHKNTRRVT